MGGGDGGGGDGGGDGGGGVGGGVGGGDGAAPLAAAKMHSTNAATSSMRGIGALLGARPSRKSGIRGRRECDAPRA